MLSGVDDGHTEFCAHARLSVAILAVQAAAFNFHAQIFQGGRTVLGAFSVPEPNVWTLIAVIVAVIGVLAVRRRER